MEYSLHPTIATTVYTFLADVTQFYISPEVVLPSFSQIVGTMSITGNPELTCEGRGKVQIVK